MTPETWTGLYIFHLALLWAELNTSPKGNFRVGPINIAKGTTDPGYWVIFFDCIEFVFILAAEITQVLWHHLHNLRIRLPGGATCIATLPKIALFASSVGIGLNQ